MKKILVGLLTVVFAALFIIALIIAGAMLQTGLKITVLDAPTWALKVFAVLLTVIVLTFPMYLATIFAPWRDKKLLDFMDKNHVETLWPDTGENKITAWVEESPIGEMGIGDTTREALEHLIEIRSKQ